MAEPTAKNDGLGQPAHAPNVILAHGIPNLKTWSNIQRSVHSKIIKTSNVGSSSAHPRMERLILIRRTDGSPGWPNIHVEYHVGDGGEANMHSG